MAGSYPPTAIATTTKLAALDSATVTAVMPSLGNAMAPSIGMPSTPNRSSRCCSRMAVLGSAASIQYGRAWVLAPMTPGTGSRWVMPATSRATMGTYYIAIPGLESIAPRPVASDHRDSPVLARICTWTRSPTVGPLTEAAHAAGFSGSA